jgi:hypothetical protein
MIETITAMAAMIGVLDGFTTEGTSMSLLSRQHRGGPDETRRTAVFFPELHRISIAKECFPNLLTSE